jgi:hypothetical protein
MEYSWWKKGIHHTLEEELVTIAGEELGAFGSNGGDGMRDAGQKAQDDKKHRACCRAAGVRSSVERAEISNNCGSGWYEQDGGRSAYVYGVKACDESKQEVEPSRLVTATHRSEEGTNEGSRNFA